jgi:hypothetical protein
MSGPKYLCYKCQEDLTAQVLSAREESPLVEVPLVKSLGFTKMGRAASGGSWRVEVECSNGHPNIFEGTD